MGSVDGVVEIVLDEESTGASNRIGAATTPEETNGYHAA